MKKKVISAMLAAAMIISVTGCGNNGGTESAKDTTASGTETAVSDTKTVQRRLNSGQTTVMTRHI